MRILFFGLAVALSIYAFADPDGSYVFPQNHTAIRYDKAPVTDRVASLQRQLRENKAKLDFNESHGYLEAVLRALDVPVAIPTSGPRACLILNSS